MLLLGAFVTPFFGVLWLFTLGSSVIHRQVFRCPRCGKLFFGKTLDCLPFSPRCVYCGLPKWTAMASVQGSASPAERAQVAKNPVIKDKV